MNEGEELGSLGERMKSFLYLCKRGVHPAATIYRIIHNVFLQIVVVFSLLGLIFSHLNCLIVLGLHLKFISHIQILNKLVQQFDMFSNEVWCLQM